MTRAAAARSGRGWRGAPAPLIAGAVLLASACGGDDDDAGASSAPPSTRPETTTTTIASERYTVRSGDTLSHIAARYDTTVEEIAELNGLTDLGTLDIGQVLDVPTS